MIDDEIIVKGLKSEDDVTRDLAIRRLVNKYQDHLYSFALRWLKDEHSAQTLVNDTFLTVIDKIGQFSFQEKNKRFQSWVFRIIGNKLRDTYRKRKRDEEKIRFVSFDETRLEDPEGQVATGDIAVRKKIVDDYFSAENVEKNPLIQKIGQFVRSLSERDQIIITKCASGLAHEEVAEYAGINKNQVKVYYYRLKQRLRKYLRSN